MDASGMQYSGEKDVQNSRCMCVHYLGLASGGALDFGTSQERHSSE